LVNSTLQKIKNIDDFIISKLSIHHGTLISLSIICCVSFFVRIYYSPWQIPISLDGAGYFWYAIDMKISGSFPTNYNYPNTGWSMFLSLFFSMLNSGNFIDYMNLQRTLSILVSVLTIPIVFLLCKKFVDYRYALLGSLIFSFEPRVILNSTLGITDTLYVFLVACALSLLLSKNDKANYFAFVALGLSVMTRYEGLLLIAPFSIIFILKNRKKTAIGKYLIAISLFLLIVIPIAYIRIQTTGNDGLTSHVFAGSGYYQHISQSGDDGPRNFINLLGTGIINFFKYFSWSMIPIFWFFIPIGVTQIFRNRDHGKISIIIIAITMSVPAFYAYSRGLHEVRYFLVFYPLFCIAVSYTFKILLDRTNYKFLITCVIIIGVLLGSFVFLDYKKIDPIQENEKYNLAKIIVGEASGTNDITPITKYYSAAGIFNKNFPILKDKAVQYEPKIIQANSFRILNEYLKYGMTSKLSHLVLDGQDSNDFLNDIYLHEEKYPYLEKQFDAEEKGFQYHVKIFKIDYDIIRQMKILELKS